MTMPQAIFKAALLAILATAATGVSAETAFPAADFKPSVIYLAPDFASHTSGGTVSAAPAAAAHDSRYPAASFEPTVVYKSADWASHGGAAAPAQPAYDPRYPAAYFEPKVIYRAH